VTLRRGHNLRDSACCYRYTDASRSALECDAPGHDRHRVILLAERRTAVLRELADRGALADGAAREEADAAVALAASEGRLG
jgi:hypothetical protein